MPGAASDVAGAARSNREVASQLHISPKTVELEPGEHRYRFLVDGQWRDDPECTFHAPNPYRSEDAVCEVA